MATADHEDEEKRIANLKNYENLAYQEGFKILAGMDEVGRGCIAGPVVAAAVILPKDFFLAGVNDSKLLSEKKRLQLAAVIKREAVAWSVAAVSAGYIDRENILQATREAMRMAVQELSPQPDFLLLDALTLPGLHIRQYPLIKGDRLSISIACASIIAKVERDYFMQSCDTIYPGYGFARHKGYGTRDHIEAIGRLGSCPLHRQSFAPLKSITGGNYGSQPSLF